MSLRTASTPIDSAISKLCTTVCSIFSFKGSKSIPLLVSFFGDVFFYFFAVGTERKSGFSGISSKIETCLIGEACSLPLIFCETGSSVPNSTTVLRLKEPKLVTLTLRWLRLFSFFASKRAISRAAAASAKIYAGITVCRLLARLGLGFYNLISATSTFAIGLAIGISCGATGFCLPGLGSNVGTSKFLTRSCSSICSRLIACC